MKILKYLVSILKIIHVSGNQRNDLYPKSLESSEESPSNGRGTPVTLGNSSSFQAGGETNDGDQTHPPDVSISAPHGSVAGEPLLSSSSLDWGVVSPPHIPASPLSTMDVAEASSPYSAGSIVIDRLEVSSSCACDENSCTQTRYSTHTNREGSFSHDEQCTNKPTGSCNHKNRNSFDDKTPAHVLIMHPIYAGSHEVVLRELAKDLVGRGHKVTQLRWKSDNMAIDVTREIYSGKLDNLTDAHDVGGGHVDVITVSADNRDLRYPYMSETGALQPPAKLLWDTERSILNVPTDVFGLIDAHCSTLLGDTSLYSALNSSQFTVAVVDLIANECSLALAHRLGLPAVGYWGFPLQGGEPRRMGVYQMPSVVPAMMSELGGEMTLLERTYNTVLAVLDELLMLYHTSITDKWIQLLLPGVPSSSELLSNVEAVLVSVSWHLDYPKLLPPHVHYIGCFLCRPGRPLDHQLQRWVNSSDEAGVIVFSFGLTGFDSSVVPEKFREGALAALEHLPHKVVLHFDPTKLPRIPANVLAMPRIPQQDLLAHPATRVFVSHCGMNSVNEAVYHGVPLLCVPNFADQGDIARRVTDRGFGVTLAKDDLTKITLTEKLTELLGNPKYRRTVERASRMWQEEPSGLERSVDWILKVHRHGPLLHTRPAGTALSFSQYYCLDVFCILLFAFGVWLWLATRLLRWCSGRRRVVLDGSKVKLH